LIPPRGREPAPGVGHASGIVSRRAGGQDRLGLYDDCHITVPLTSGKLVLYRMKGIYAPDR